MTDPSSRRLWHAAALALGLLAAAAPARAAERSVSIDGGKAPLYGTLETPDAGARAGAAVLLIAGSGPTDRDGNSNLPGVRPATLKLLAEGLAQRGLTSLRFDKRAIAASAAAAPAEQDLRFGTYVADAVAWTRYLAARPGVACVVVAGHSEGALIAAMAAQRTPVCGVVEMSGAGRPAGQVLRDQLATLPEPLHARALATLSELEAGRPVAAPPLPALFRPSVQPYLISWLPIDPAAELGKVRAPVLILQGGHDLQVTLGDYTSLVRARPDASVLVLSDANHVLKDAPAERGANLAAYADPARPLDPQVVPAVAAFAQRAAAGH